MSTITPIVLSLSRSPLLDRFRSIIGYHRTMKPARSTEIPDDGSDSAGSYGDTRKITLRSRKNTDGNLEIKQIICDFKSEMLSLLHEFKKSQCEGMQLMRSDVADIKNQLLSIRDTNEKLISEHSQFKIELSSLRESLQFHSKEQDVLKSSVDAFDAKVKSMDSLGQELSKVRCQLNDLQMERNLQNQRDRLNNLEISGIPEKRNENIKQYLVSIAKLLAVQMPDDEIVHIHRVPTRVSGRPKNIIVKFKSLIMKDSFISAMRKRRSLSTSDIGVSGDPFPVYLNEHLTPFYKDLYKKAKEAKRTAGFQYIWVRNCKIHLRRNDNSPALIIKSLDDITKIK